MVHSLHKLCEITLIGLLLLAFSSNICAQDITTNRDVMGESFVRYISFNGEPSLIAYYVPDTYDSLVPSKMILALHYCGGGGAGDAIIYRNLLIDLADNINAVVVAPYCHNTGPPAYSIPDPSIITISIDSSIIFLNIDTNYIYLTGGSCNGNSAFKYGLDEIYAFRGIIPFNAYIPSISPGYYNFDSDMPSCICSGTIDPSYTNNMRLYDSLVAHDAITHMNPMPGIGHEFNFPEFTEEMNECIEFIDSVSLIPTSIIQNGNQEAKILIYPNPVKEVMHIEITSDGSEKIRVESFNATGSASHLLFNGVLRKGINKVSINVRAGDFSKGLNIIRISTDKGLFFRKVIAVF